MIPERESSVEASRKKAFYSDPGVKPTVPTTDPAGIPAELKAARRWVAWRLEWDGGKGRWDKVPVNPWSKHNAKANRPETWGTFEAGLAALAADPTLAGLGYEFEEGAGEFGIDLDDCRDPATGVIAPWASEIIDLFGTYVEISPSGTGVKLIGRGTLPYARKLGDREAYGSGRYFTVTGRPIPASPPGLADCQGVIDAHFTRLFPRREKNRASPPHAANAASGSGRCPAAADVVGKVLGPWKNGAKARRLWDGGADDYDGDHSRADAALCAFVAFFAGPNPDLIDAVFRQSKLYRPEKWNAVHSTDGRTYGQMTVSAVLDGCRDFYQWRARIQPPPTADPGGGGAVGDPPPVPGEGERLAITVGAREYLTNAQAVAALRQSRGLYQRGELLVRVVEVPGNREEAGHLAIDRPSGPRLRFHDADSLRDEITRVADFVEKKVNADGDETLKSVHPPAWCMKEVARKKYWPGVPRLTALVGYPVLTPDGRVLTSPGYDAATGIYLHGEYSDLTVPERPTREDARAAVGVLADLVCDFPFEGPAHLAGWVCALLTPLARFAFRGPAPLFLFDANVRSAGKTLLADLVAAIVTGGEFARAGYTCDKVEMEKVITALAAAGDPMVLFDNVTGRFGDASLDKAITGLEWQGRVLGTSTMFRGPLGMVFYATSNNCDVHGDTVRRVQPCRIAHPDEFPEDKTQFKYRLPDWAHENRDRLLAAALTVLKAYVAAGRPNQTLSPWGSFGGWSSLVRSAVVWAGLEDPARAKDRLREESDREGTAMRQLLAALAAKYPEGRPFTTREVIKNAGGDEVVAGWDEVADLLALLEATTTGKLGYKFRHYRERNFGGLRLDQPRTGAKGKDGARWVIVPHANPRSPAASSPSPPAGSVPPSRGGGHAGHRPSSPTGAGSTTPASEGVSEPDYPYPGDDGDDGCERRDESWFGAGW